MLISWYNVAAIYTKSKVVNNYLVVFIVYLKLLKCPIEDNKALMTTSYLQVRANYKTIKLWSALMTASYLLSVLSSVFSGCLDSRLQYANIYEWWYL